ncbi:MAG: glutamate mutase L [Chloroflexi bacterium]|nr:glutamate mutase L [Chloroflexota bacterium]
MPDSKLESLLVADCGSVNTKVGLVDWVDGIYRFIGAGTAATTSDDITVGLRRAVQQVEARTGRRLLTDDGNIIAPERIGAQGVDAVVALTSAPPPLRVAIVGLSRDVSVASALDAIHGTYATVVAILALDETGRRWLPVDWDQDVVTDQTGIRVAMARRKSGESTPDPAVIAAEALAHSKPDVIVLVGGVDGGATNSLFEITNLIASIVASREESARPVIIFAGNREVRPQIAQRLGDLTELRVVDNVRPTMERADPAALQAALESLYAERKVAYQPGMDVLLGMTPINVVSTARAFENVVRFVARLFDLNVLGADIGSNTTTLVVARREAYSRVVRADLGVGQNIERVIAVGGVAALLDWLPMELTEDDALTRCLNRAAHPRSIPVTREEARLAQAAGRVALMSAARASNVDVNDLDLILLTGGLLANNTNLGAMALLALDALQPSGVFTLAVDTFGLAPAFGALAAVNAEAAAMVLERDGFVTLGTVIAPLSNLREGQVDLNIKIKPQDGGVMNLEVHHGSLEIVPLAPGQKAQLEVRPAVGVSLGRGRRGVLKAEVEGGALGLIIDARGRPIALPEDPEKRRTKIQQWYWDIGGEVAYG